MNKDGDKVVLQANLKQLEEREYLAKQYRLAIWKLSMKGE